jgi:hypothetical protein
MRISLMAGMAVSLLAAGAASAQSINLSGVWKVQGSIQAGASVFSATPTCTFQQAGTQLSGTCVGANASGPLTGVVSGANVSWTWTHQATDAVGNSGVTAFSGAYVDDHLVQGTMTSSGVPGQGTFTLTR